MINEFVWNLYLKSGGQDVVDMFRHNLTEDFTTEYVDAVKDMHLYYCASRNKVEDTSEQLMALVEELSKDNGKDVSDEADDGDYDIEAILNDTWNDYSVDSDKDDRVFASFIGGLAYTSTLLAVLYPEDMVPYYFVINYNVLEKIAASFDIKLPNIPAKKDYKGRFYHYGELCKAFKAFRESNGWDLYEFCAFLYDFAPKYIGGIDSYIVKDLPEPKSAYFIGGGGDNADATAEDEPDNICLWQCSPSTRAGDMIVMYLRTPISAISSVWRSVSIGFNDPFFYYYRCTYIGRPVKVKRISLDKIKADKVLGAMPIVNKNMQGINGVELMPSEYNHILGISRCKEPKLEYSAVDADGEYPNEKEVEDQVIKPFLKELGYYEGDYVQQLYVEIGNHNNTLIPDFVLMPDDRGAYKRAFAIVEVKRSITKEKELEDALTQARSYALLLRVKYAVVASQEGLWILSDKDEYSDVVNQYKWTETKDDDVLYKIRKMIGKN